MSSACESRHRGRRRRAARTSHGARAGRTAPRWRGSTPPGSFAASGPSTARVEPRIIAEAVAERDRVLPEHRRATRHAGGPPDHPAGRVTRSCAALRLDLHAARGYRNRLRARTGGPCRRGRDYPPRLVSDRVDRHRRRPHRPCTRPTTSAARCSTPCRPGSPRAHGACRSPPCRSTTWSTPPPEHRAHSELFGVRFWQTEAGCVIAGRSMVIDIADSRRRRPPPRPRRRAAAGELRVPAARVDARRPRALHGARRRGRARRHRAAAPRQQRRGQVDAGGRRARRRVARAVRRPHHPGDPSATGFVVHGVHKAPAIPAEIGGLHVERATHLGDLRERVGLERDVLTTGGHRLGGVVLIVHADSPDGSLRALRGHEVLPLLMQSFAGQRRAQRVARRSSRSRHRCASSRCGSSGTRPTRRSRRATGSRVISTRSRRRDRRLNVSACDRATRARAAWRRRASRDDPEAAPEGAASARAR